MRYIPMWSKVLDLSIVQKANEDFEAAEFIEEWASLHRQAQVLEIVTPDDTVAAANLLKDCNSFIKRVEISRKEVTEPLQEFVKGAIAKEKELVKPAVQSKDIIQQKVKAYNEKLEQIRKEEAARIQKEKDDERAREEAERKRREEEEAAQRKKEDDELAEMEADDAEKAAKQKEIEDERIRREFAENKAKREEEERMKKLEDEAKQKQAVLDANSAAAKPKWMTSYWKYEIEDETQVPLAYCSPDSAKINAAIKAGVREIPGVRVYEDKIMK